MVSMENGGASVGAAEDRMAGLSVSNGEQAAEPGPGAIVAVGKAKSVSLPAPDLSKVKSVETHTRALGIIQPPPDLRAIIDKSAAFVAKNGSAFEGKILEQQQGNPRFNFLRPNDPYNAYYKWKVADEQKGDKGVAGGPSTAAQQAQQAADIAAAAQQPVAATASTVPAKPLEPPEPDQYTVRTPEGLTAEHLDIIKLTAQCVARNGQAFLTGLVSREQGNPTFLFLKPTHSLFGFFKELCDAYSRTLMPPKELMSKLRRDASDRTNLLERCLKRLEWEKQKEALDKASADKAEAERLAMQAIDWHDFVVVETIDFFDDEDKELPPPMTQRDVILLNRAGAFEEEAAAAAGGEGGDKMEMDVEEKALLAEANAAENRQQAGVRVEMEDDEEPMKIVKGYQRPTARPAGPPGAGMVVSPITGELVPIAQMAEHMRISLIDPQWRTQREAMLSKIRETTQASDDEITRNLVDLAGHRPDVFGSTQQEVGAIVKASLDDRKMSGNNRALAWDGYTRAGQGLENQMQAVEESKKRKEPEGSEANQGPPGGPITLPPPPTVKPPGQPVTLPPPPVKPPTLPPPSQPLAEAPPASGGLPPPPLARPPPLAPPPTVQPPGRPPTLPPPPGAALPPPVGLPPAPQAQPAAAAAPSPAETAPAPPEPEDAPEAKRQRVDFVLQDEEEFLQQHPGTSKVRIHCPEESDNDSLNGQVLEVEVESLSTTIGELKQRLSEVVSLPRNKQQLSREHFKTMRDNQTLAYYNVSQGVDLSLSVRRRGGR